MRIVQKAMAFVFNIVLIVLFLAMLWLPFADQQFGLDKATASQEKRRMARMPKWRWESSFIDQFPQAFEDYYNDNFGFRNLFIRTHNRVKYELLGVSPNPKVWIGKEGWLFGGIDKATEYARHANSFSSAELEAWRRTIEERQVFCKELGIDFVVVFAPRKYTIYPEYAPDALKPRVSMSRLDQVLAHLRENTNVDVVDLRESLREVKPQFRLYHRTDSHWNYAGGAVAAQAVIGHLATEFPNLRPTPLDEFRLGSRQQTGDYARMIGLDDLLPEEELVLWPINEVRWKASKEGLVPITGPVSDGGQPFAHETGIEALPTAVMFRDSYSLALVPYLSDHFERIVYMAQSEMDFDWPFIEREHPDVVIWELVETRLMTPPPPNLLEGRTLAYSGTK